MKDQKPEPRHHPIQRIKIFIWSNHEGYFKKVMTSMDAASVGLAKGMKGFHPGNHAPPLTLIFKQQS